MPAWIIAAAKRLVKVMLWSRDNDGRSRQGLGCEDSVIRELFSECERGTPNGPTLQAARPSASHWRRLV